jgi:uncharacterized membrane protein
VCVCVCVFISLVGIFRCYLYRFNHTKGVRREFVFHKVILAYYIIFSQIFVHTSYEPLYKHVTKDALPKEFGGNLDSMTSYHSKLYNALVL